MMFGQTIPSKLDFGGKSECNIQNEPFSLHETQQLAKLMAASDENGWDLETLCGVSNF